MAHGGALVSFPTTNKAGDGRGVIFGDPKNAPQGLIVLHEWWGMNDQIQIQGNNFSKNGHFTVLVPDLYRGKVADDREEAGHLMDGLDWDGALTDLTGAATFLKERGCTKVGVTGFCLGGALSLAAAVRCPEISAAAPFYGIPKATLADLTKIKIPIQAHFAKRDDYVGFSSPQDYEPLKVKLMVAGVSLEFYAYDAGHAFTNINHPNYNKDICDLSFKRLYEFMQKHLN